MNKSLPKNYKDKWWKEAVVYQIYPRSFKDSNGDGIGDLRGIISKLDYIKSLGIDVVWLNPIYTSPNKDNGYDVSDYRNLMPEAGTIKDFDELLAGLHQRGIKLFMDLVLNHCSSEHEWFKQAKTSRESPFYSYFHWWPAEKGTPPMRWSHFDENANAWEYNPDTDSYYLHYFAKSQPDLNWENPKLRQEIFDIMKYWLDKGIDGFRLDAVAYISKDINFPPLPAKYGGQWEQYYANGPFLHDYLKQMNREVLSQYNAATVAEALVSEKEALKMVDPKRKELDMAYHFEGAHFGYLPGEYKTPDPNGLNLVEWKKVYSKWDKAFANKGWGTIYLGNHDQPRMVSRWGNDSPEFRELSSKMLTTFILTMRGTPYYYYGDELGMDNIKFDNIEDYDDIEVKTNYAQVMKKNGDIRQFLETLKITSRDNGRTPMQWDNTTHAGFSETKPWLKINPNYISVNVGYQEINMNSTLHFFRQMVQLRKKDKCLIYGKYTLLDAVNTSVYAYTREWRREKRLVLLNFTGKNADVDLKFDVKYMEYLLGNYCDDKEYYFREHLLRPFESLVIRLKSGM